MAGKRHSTARENAEPRQLKPARGAKSGVKPGATPSTPNKDAAKRPIEEEEIFGGAERTHDARISSDKAKP